MSTHGLLKGGAVVPELRPRLAGGWCIAPPFVRRASDQPQCEVSGRCCVDAHGYIRSWSNIAPAVEGRVVVFSAYA